MYYGRYSRKDLDLAIAKETITTEHVALIVNFYENDVFILQGKDSVDALRSVIPDITQINYEPEQNLFFMHVNTWPHIKEMCLKFARKEPWHWIYVTQDDDKLLFNYHLDTYSIELA